MVNSLAHLYSKLNDGENNDAHLVSQSLSNIYTYIYTYTMYF